MSKLVSKKSQTFDKELLQPRLIHSGEREGRIYEFGPFQLDTSERVLTQSGGSVQLTPKAFDILLLLVENRGRLLSKSLLMDAIWPDTFVEEKTLTQNIFTLRKALGRDQAGQHYIETIPKHGYRFRAEVEAVPRTDYKGTEKKLLAGLAVVEKPMADEAESIKGESRTTEHANVISQPVMPAHQSFAGRFTHLPESSDIAPVAHRWVYWKLIIPVSIAVAVLIVAALIIAKFVYPGVRLAKSAFQKISIARLTNGGNISALALAPDGKYVAYATIHGDMQSLFIRQVDTTSAVEIVQPAPVGYRGITFSRDGAWVYYVTVEKDSFVGTLYRVPILGGTSQKVLQESVGSRIEFSPDGRQIAFVHWTDRTHTALIIANVDGTGERQLATLDYEDGFSIDGPAWSPDGKTILAPTQSYNGKQPFASVVAINVDDGRTQTLLGNRWNWIGQMTWLADGSGIILTAWNGDSEIMSDQIWLMTYPSGETRRLTNDVNGYLGVSVSTDAKVIAASDSIPAKNFWVAPDGDWTQARKITNGAGELYSERLGLACTPEGRIVYSTRQSGNPDIWVMLADGTQQKQLTFDTGADLQPVATPDGRYIIFISSRTGKNQLWRIDADGGNPLLLASMEGARFPSISPDGQWVVYEGNAEGKSVVWRVPLGGGTPVRLTEGTALLPVVSPDSKLIACLLPNEAPGPSKLSLLSLIDGRVIKQFETLVPRSTPALRWSPDGRSLTYVVTRQGISNIWSQPIDGGAPKALTDWKSDLIYRFDWFRDGRLLCERGSTMTDIILIRDAGSK
ncbi:MAG TPA: winged helix-turn-helix domain-containing protein [Pyrinomonadaceae bacterium]|nr:winged helix-turn-helix domain-containing protein [Pyrinomonadaceae bacterium]